MAEVTITHDPERERFVLHLGDELASLLDYHRGAGAVDLVHARTQPRHRGQGLAGQVTAAALDHARAHEWQVRPSCPYVRTWMQDHPESQDLVPEADRARLFGTDDAAGTRS